MARKTAVINREPAPIDFIFIVCLLKCVLCRITVYCRSVRDADSKVDLDPELDVARQPELPERSERRAVGLAQAVKLIAVQRRYIERVWISSGEALRQPNVKIVQRQRSARQSVANNELLDLRQQRGAGGSSSGRSAG